MPFRMEDNSSSNARVYGLDAGKATAGSEFDDAALIALHPNYLMILRIVTGAFTLPVVIGALALEVSRMLPAGFFIVPAVLAIAFLIRRVPLRRYEARGFALDNDRLRVVRGLLFHSDTVVPFGRVQHIDVHQGPLERYYGLATLILHTAGSHNASVRVPGLLNKDALAMRETIRAHIRREAL